MPAPFRLPVCALLLVAGPAAAIDYTWTNPAGGNFAGNFSPGGTPASAPDTVLVFPELLALPAEYVALNNLGVFTLNAIRFESLGSNSPAAVTVQAGAAAGFTLRFAANGATQPSIQVNGTATARIENGQATTGITLTDGTNLAVGGTGLGRLDLAATIGQAAGGVGRVTYNHTGPFTFAAGPAVSVGGVNTYSGGTSIVRGNVELAVNGGFGTGPLSIDGPEHSLAITGLSFGIANPVVLNQTLRFSGRGNNATFFGPVSGTGGLVTDSPFHNGSTLLTFSGTGTATGPVSVGMNSDHQFTLVYSGASGTTRHSSFEVGPRGELQLDNTQASVTRLNPASPPPLALRGGKVSLIAGTATETFGTLTASSFGVLNSSGSATLRFAGLVREQNATLDVRAIGSNNIAFLSNPGGAIGGILPYAVATNTQSNSSRNLARFDAANGQVVPLNPGNDYSFVELYAAGPAGLTQNFRRDGSTNSSGYAGLVGAVGVNALVLEESSISGPGTLTVASGALVQSSTFGGTSGVVNLGGLNFGANPGYLHVHAPQFNNAVISGSGGVVKSGLGTLTLGAANPFSGGLTINAGRVEFANDAALGAPGGAVTLNATPSGSSGSASDEAGLAFAQNRFYDPSPTAAVTTNRPIVVGPVGGALIQGISSGTWTVAGPITGSGTFKLASGSFGDGVIALTGPNTNTGKLYVSNVTLAVASDAALGAPSASLDLFGTLRVDGSFATARRVHGFGTVLLPAGQTLQLDGQVSGQTLVAVGAGELVMTATNLVEGTVAVGDDFPEYRPGAPAGTPTGATLTLRGPNGALPLLGRQTGGGLSALNGGTVHLDNSGPAGNVNLNRLGGVNVRLSGGTLRLTGNASADVTESVGDLTSTALLGTVTLAQPDSGGAGRQTALVATGYFKGTSGQARDVLFVRGTNFGAASGDRTALLLNSDPAPINGVIEGMVVATSATGSPTDFATATPAGSQFAVTPFTNYQGNLPASGGSSVNTYDQTAAGVVTGAVSANALRLSAGGSVQMTGGGGLTLGTGMLLALPGNGGLRGGTLDTSKPLRVVTSGDLSIGTAAEPTAVVAPDGFVKAGPGRLTLFGTAATTIGSVASGRPTVTVAEGTLALGNAQAVLNSTVNGAPGVLPDFKIGASAALDLTALSGPVRARGLIGFGRVELGSGTLQLGDNVRYGGNLAGTAAANVVVGTPQAEAAGNTFGGIVTLAGDNSGYAGGFTVAQGTLALVNSLSAGSGTSPIVIGDTSGTGQAMLSVGPSLSLARDIVVQAGATPAASHTLVAGGGTPNALARATTQTISGNIALGQTLQLGLGVGTDTPTVFFTGTVSGPGALRQTQMDAIFTGNNTYSGGFETSGGYVIGLGSNSTGTTGPLGTGPVRILNGRGTFLAYGGPRTLSNPVVMTGTIPQFSLSVTGKNDLTFTGSFDYSALTQPVQINSRSVGVTTLAGQVIGTQQLQKTGPGTVVFANPTGNSYAGGTDLRAGTLIAANTSGSATGAGAVTVRAGAVLGGTGSIAGPTTLTPGSALRAGTNETTAGTLTFGGNVTVQNLAILSVTLDGTSAGKVQLTGGFFDLTQASTTTVFVTGAAPATPQSFTIVDSGSVPIPFFNGAFNPANFAVSANFPFTNLSLSSPTPTTLVLNYTPVPEPTGLLLVAAAAAGVARYVRGRRGRRDDGLQAR